MGTAPSNNNNDAANYAAKIAAAQLRLNQFNASCLTGNSIVENPFCVAYCNDDPNLCNSVKQKRIADFIGLCSTGNNLIYDPKCTAFCKSSNQQDQSLCEEINKSRKIRLQDKCSVGNSIMTDPFCYGFCITDRARLTPEDLILCDTLNNIRKTQFQGTCKTPETLLDNPFCKSFCDNPNASADDLSVCDNFHRTLCNSEYGITSERCSCIHTDLTQYGLSPECADKTCREAGYMTNKQKQLSKDCPDICTQITNLDVSDSKNATISDVNLYMKCGSDTNTSSTSGNSEGSTTTTTTTGPIAVLNDKLFSLIILMLIIMLTLVIVNKVNLAKVVFPSKKIQQEVRQSS